LRGDIERHLFSEREKGVAFAAPLFFAPLAGALSWDGGCSGIRSRAGSRRKRPESIKNYREHS
jgi:hypothetical protein